MQPLSFHDIPQDYKEIIDKTNSPLLKRIYSQFHFQYLQLELTQDKEPHKAFILSFLNEFKFITYGILTQEDNPKNKNLIAICTEGKIILIETKDLNYLTQIFQESKAIIINASKNELFLSEDTSISDFCQITDFDLDIQRSYFIDFITYPIAYYIIKRFSYPTHYFKNPSFFKFDEQDDFGEKEMKEKMNEILQSDSKITEEIRSKLTKILKPNLNSEKVKQRRIYEFKEDDFIEINVLFTNEEKKHSLVLHKESLYLFSKKSVNHENTNLEEKFCKNFSSEYFTRFYGFIKQNNRITAFIYEYMCNKSYDDFIKINGENFGEFYSLLTVFRLFKGLNFLQSNLLIHRDLKPSNILIDHDFIPYISDFEFIKSINDENDESTCTVDFSPKSKNQPPEFFTKGSHSLASDIFQFGLIVYFILENKLPSNLNIDVLPKMKNGSERLKSLFYLTIKSDENDRIDINEIKSILVAEIKSLFYLDKFFLKEMSKMQISIINQYIYEHSKILNSFELENFINHVYDLLYLNLISKQKFPFVYNEFNDFDNKSNEIKKILTNIIRHEFKLMKKLDDGDLNIVSFSLFKEYNKEKYLAFLLNCIQQCYHKDVSIFDFFNESDGHQVLLFIGDLYFEGNQVEQNYLIAKEFYEKSAWEGNSTSYNRLGYIFLNGIGTEKDIDTALYYYDESANLKNEEALIFLGDLYYTGNIVEKDVPKALIYYEQLADLGNSNALLHLGNIYYKGNYVKRDLKKASNYYKKAANLDNSEAQSNLADLFFYGEGEVKDVNRAMDLYKKSANKQNPFALLRLGDLYTYKDINLAKQYLHKSADLGNSDAYVHLGAISMLGLDGKQNFEDGVKYFQIASEKFNNHNAYMYLGYYYMNQEDNKKKAIECFKKAAENNNSDSLYNLGDIYYEGEIVECNPEESIKYYLRCIQNYIDKNKLFASKIVSPGIINSCDTFYYVANNKIGLIYLLFYNNIQEAFKYLRTAACGEFANGQINFGLLLYLFYDNKEEAEHFLNKAIKNKIAMAEFALGFIREKEGKINESISLFIQASNHVNEKVKLFSQIITDARFEVSKIFILCYTNLKLFLFYLKQNDIDNAKKYFVRAFFSLMFEYEKSPYRFRYINNNDVFARLDEFLFQIPMFNLKNQFNLDNINQVCSKDEENDKEEEPVEKEINNFISIIKKKSFDDENESNDLNENNENDNNDSDSDNDSDDEVNDEDEILLFRCDVHKSYCRNIQQFIREIYQYNIEDSKLKKKEIEQLFKFIFKNNSRKSIYKNINFIVKKMDMILNERPYVILFGQLKTA